MIQYYRDLEKQVKSIKAKNLEFGQIQKIYSTAYYISITVRVPGKTNYLYLGRGGGHEGVWIHDSAPVSLLRRKDNFLEYFRRHLSSCTFLGIELDSQDRIIKLRYQKFGEEQDLLLFWRGRKLYFLHYYRDEPGLPFRVMLSWKTKSFVPETEITDLYSFFDEVGRNNNMDQTRDSAEIVSMEDLLTKELKLVKDKGEAGNPTFLQRKKKNIEEDLRKAKQWEKLLDHLNKEQPLGGIYELKVEDQKIKFSSDLNPFERRDKVFQKIKKLKKGEEILKMRLENVEEQLSGKKVEEKIVNKIPLIKPIWGIEKASTVTVEKVLTTDYKVFKLDEYHIGVGTNAQGNDQLRNKWGGKEDMWLHLDNQKSSHVVIKNLKNQTISPEMLNIGASILAYFSHFDSEWIPIIYTQVKNLKAVSGSPGMVNYKKEKRLQCQRVNINEIVNE